MTNKNKRKAIPKKLRFEVFKRDKFKCGYCGATAPDILLQVDHINPVANGGENEILNLITACFDCNNGKRDKLLDDNTVAKKQRVQLEELQERREQIEMMLVWQKELSGIKDLLLFDLKEYWEELAPGFTLNDIGLKTIKKLLRVFSHIEIKEAMDISAEQYLEYSRNVVTESSWEIAFKKVEGIAKVRKDLIDNPDLKEIFYIRGILKNRIRGCFDASLALNIIKTARQSGVSLDNIRQVALKATYIDDFEEHMAELVNRQK